MNVFTEFALTILLALLATIVVAVFGNHLPKIKSHYTSAHLANLFFWSLALLYIVTFGILSILRHDSFHSGGFDLGIFDQNIWNSLHGRLFHASIPLKTQITLGQHFSPLLLAIVPLYALWLDARTLLILQTLALALGALPLYWYARKQLGNGLAIAVTMALLLSPAMQSVNLWEFHEIALATPLLCFALFFLLNAQTRPFLVCLVLALLLKEEIGMIMASFGVYIFLAHRNKWMGLGLAIFGIAWTAIMLMYVIPAFRDPFYGLDYQYVDRYQYLGNSVTEIVTAILTQPGLVIEHLVVPSKIEFMLHLFVPLAFTPLLGIEILALAIPSLAYLLIGDNPFQNSIRFQYTALLVPFVFFATVLGLKRIREYTNARKQPGFGSMGLVALIGVASLTNYFFQSAGPLGLEFDPSQYTITEHTRLGYELMRYLPPNASVLADMGLVPHLSHRQNVYQASIQDPPDMRKIEYIFADRTTVVHRDFPIIWEGILNSPQFQVVVEQDGYIIMKRATPNLAHPLSLQFDDHITLRGYTIESNTPAQPGTNAQIILTWNADQDVHERYITFMHLVDAQNHIIAQDDHEPMNGWLRTDRWKAGDLTIERYTLELPRELARGDYYLMAGLYRVADSKNLIARDPNGNILGATPILGVLKVTQ